MCFETGLSVLLDIDFWLKRANLITAAIAFIALGFGWYQVVISKKESRRSTAYAAYQSYLSLCFEHTKLGRGLETEITCNEEVYARYRWFIANMLFSFEQILEVSKGDEEWKTAIRHQLKRHRWHLSKSKSIQRKEWSDELCKLITNLQ